MLDAMDTMDQFEVSSKSQYIEKLSELRAEENRLRQELREVRLKENSNFVSEKEQEIVEKLDDLEFARAQLLRLRTSMEKDSRQCDKGGFDR